LNGISLIKGLTLDGAGFTAIPYYANSNRGKTSLRVWLKQDDLAANDQGWEDALYRPL
jgi:hypothetical protein